MIYHITTRQDWEAQKNALNFIAADYHREGFIHCCTEAQVAGVLERYFKGKINLVLMHLDETKLKAELKFEVSTNNEEFPHVYGPINNDAVVTVRILN